MSSGWCKCLAAARVRVRVGMCECVFILRCYPVIVSRSLSISSLASRSTTPKVWGWGSPALETTQLYVECVSFSWSEQIPLPRTWPWLDGATPVSKCGVKSCRIPPPPPPALDRRLGDPRPHICLYCCGVFNMCVKNKAKTKKLTIQYFLYLFIIYAVNNDLERNRIFIFFVYQWKMREGLRCKRVRFGQLLNQPCTKSGEALHYQKVGASTPIGRNRDMHSPPSLSPQTHHSTMVAL
jgi:hypothetical protein